MRMSVLLLLCALMFEGWFVVRHFVFRRCSNKAGCRNGGYRIVKGLVVMINLAYTGFVVMAARNCICNKVRFRDAAVLVGMSVLTEKLGHLPSEAKWFEQGGGIRIRPSGDVSTNECACVQLVANPFGVYVR